MSEDLTPSQAASAVKRNINQQTAETVKRRRRKRARLAIYPKMGGTEFVVLDLSGGSEQPEIYTGGEAQCEGFIEGAKWAGVAE